MAMDDRHKDVECSSSCSRNCIDTIERHPLGWVQKKSSAYYEEKPRIQGGVDRR